MDMDVNLKWEVTLEGGASLKIWQPCFESCWFGKCFLASLFFKAVERYFLVKGIRRELTVGSTGSCSCCGKWKLDVFLEGCLGVKYASLGMISIFVFSIAAKSNQLKKKTVNKTNLNWNHKRPHLIQIFLNHFLTQPQKTHQCFMNFLPIKENL